MNKFHIRKTIYGDEWIKTYFKDDQQYYAKTSLGYERYFTNDRRPHRLEGPALIGPDGSKSWWIDGKLIPAKSQEEFENSAEYKSFINVSSPHIVVSYNAPNAASYNGRFSFVRKFLSILKNILYPYAK